MGAVGVIEVPTSPDNPAVAKYEAYRKKASASAVSYLIGQIDDTNGSSNINMYSVVIVTNDGQQVKALGIGAAVSGWQQVFGVNDVKDYNRGVSLINDAFYLLPGAKGTVILSTDKPISSVRRVYCYPLGGFDQVEMTKIAA